jgi:iron(III) transport system ATP-binding protein
MATPIAIRDITKTYPAQGVVARNTAVDHVSLDIESGELYFLLGPSGCGKTTLLRMIAGFIEPTSGSIHFGTRDVTFLSPNHRNTGMVFQSYALWPHMTVATNVAFGLSVRKTPAAESSSRVIDALRAVRMEPYSERKPNQLSGGQQQRVALARAIVVRPDVLLLDEPLSNLDAKLRIELRTEIRRICKESGITTVYVTHDQKEALSMADRVAILNQGRVVQVGTPRDLYRRPASVFVAEFLGETNLIPFDSNTPIDDVLATYTTAAGPVVAPRTAHARGVLSIRPESIRLQPRESVGLRGRVTSATYLGELAQYTIELPANTRLSVSVLNPGDEILATGSNTTLTIAPGDIHVLGS